MESQAGPGPTSLALRPRIKNALQKAFTAQKDKAPREAPPKNQEIAPESQQKQHEAAAATQFHRFPDLPTELRLEIWEAATRFKRYVILDPPCNTLAVCVRLWLRSHYHEPDNPGDRVSMWTSRRTPPPVLLSVSREAREVALRTWQLAFAYGRIPARLVSSPLKKNINGFIYLWRVWTASSRNEEYVQVVLGWIPFMTNYQR